MALFRLTFNPHSQIPTVFIHGGPGANSGLFLGAILRHGSQFFQSHIILHDQINCGFDISEPLKFNFKNLCLHLVEDLKPFEKVHLLAESFGCTLALYFARKFPHKVASLVLVGPHFDRQQAQLTIYSRASISARKLHDALVSEDYSVVYHFLNRKNEKVKFRNESKKIFSIAKDISMIEWTNEKIIRYEEELLLAVRKGIISIFLKECLLEVFEKDLQLFTDFSNSQQEQLSTEKLKNLAKKYELFFVSSKTFQEVKKCREIALLYSRSPYNLQNLDLTNKQYSKDLENETDWESRNSWPWVEDVLQNGCKVSLIIGEQDPFASGGSSLDFLKQYSNFCNYTVQLAGHSPIYEMPEITFKFMESIIYGK